MLSPTFPPKLKLLGCDLAVRFVWFYCHVVFLFFFHKSSQCISAQKLFLTSSFEVEYSCKRDQDLLAMTSVKNAASPSGVRLRGLAAAKGLNGIEQCCAAVSS